MGYIAHTNPCCCRGEELRGSRASMLPQPECCLNCFVVG
uniref:Uncharacterized protein n=1 Tax=Setaria italica TaxID=4555 RepID=K3ZPA4_SETIT